LTLLTFGLPAYHASFYAVGCKCTWFTAYHNSLTLFTLHSYRIRVGLGIP